MRTMDRTKRVGGTLLLVLTLGACDFISPVETNPNAVPTATVDQLVTALTTPSVGAVRETKALLQGAESRSLGEQRLLEREAQARRFHELAPLMST